MGNGASGMLAPATLRSLPSWFLRIECDRCGKVQVVNEAHAQWHDRALRAILARMRHDGCGGLPAKAELLTGIQGHPVSRIRSRGLKVEREHGSSAA